jgi:uncharacterized membrane protein YdjX (TVP38/TMEM64 family)
MSEDGYNVGVCKKNLVWVKLLVLFLLIAGLTALLYETDAIRFFLSRNRLMAFLDSLGPWSVVGFVLLQALQVVAAPIPGDASGLLGGFLYGPVLGVIVSTLGLTLGSWVAFGLSRAFGRPFVEKLVSPSTIERFDYLMHAKGAFLVFMLFLIPCFPKDYLCYILGLGRISTAEFLVIGGAGRLFGTILLTLGGNFIRLHQYGRFSILVGVALTIVLVAIAYKDKLETLFRKWHHKHHRKPKPKYSQSTTTAS